MSLNPKIQDWSGRRVWLVGASSGIGAALAHRLHAAGALLTLSARREAALRALELPGALVLPCDVTRHDELLASLRAMKAARGGVDLVVYLAGDYTPMRVDSFDLQRAERIVEVNFNAALRLTSVLMDSLEAGGGIAFVSSVAGYRGLPKALAYGPGKAALIHFAECLYLDLAPKGIGVWVINPGFVATALTAQNDFHMPALQTPEQAAEAIVEGFASGAFEIHFPKRFTRLLKLIAVLPYRWSFALIRRSTGG